MRFHALISLTFLAACTSGNKDNTDTDVPADTDVAVVDTDAPDTDLTDPCADPLTADAGVICTIAGIAGLAAVGPEDVLATDSELYLPVDMTVGPDGLLYVIDWNNHRVRRIDDDNTIHTIAGTGFLGDGPIGDARHAAFNHPTNLVFNPLNPNELYIAAWHNSRIEKLDLAAGTVSFECGTGARSYGGDGGMAATAPMDLPSAIAFEDDGSFYLADSANQIIRKVAVDHTITTIAGEIPTISQEPVGACTIAPCTIRKTGFDGDGGPALSAHFNFGFGQKTDPTARILRDGRTLYITDSYNHVVRKMDLDEGTVSAFAGTGLMPGHTGDGGQATAATLNYPTDVAVDGDHNVYIADTANHCVRKVDTDGVISTVVGVCGEFGFDGDGGPATGAHLLKPYGVEYDASHHRLIIADTENQVIRAVNL